ncbi:hypothetical protein PLEOSDRAFT_1074679 [Pleurotus ostreatus PC15]|uniref:Copper-fist domain-containing protein n=1 Tax=Pleurotus ostreatus (strain PC15) TaxID=1137138 RepID=A0A067NTA6_PLEO1|nr:hypothetical protein PLEOSDRAFT_1074679 [Pleurotus ostreatus PC15]
MYLLFFLSVSLSAACYISPLVHPSLATESCIKGHRSSSCTHPDRPLFEVKKKGRPVSQCEKCRELRQSRRVHSKCTCNDKATPTEPPEPNLLTLARVAAMRRPGDTADGGPSSTSGKRQGIPKRIASRPSTPPALGHKRVKSVISDIQPRLELPPIFSPLPSTPFPTSLPSFPTMPPLSAVASLAGSGCTCGLTCACPDCEEHPGPQASGDCCGKSCNHCVDPTLIALPGSSSPSGKSIIDQFFARAASLPQPPSSRRFGNSAMLDTMNTTVYPSTAHGADERGVAFGLVNLPKLECCGGNCGCPNGLCGCGQACNGSSADNTQPIPRDEAASSNAPAKTPEPVKPIRSCCAGR